jgi:hypothetical protein
MDKKPNVGVMAVDELLELGVDGNLVDSWVVVL